MTDLTNRLRCKYPNGPLINGEPEFGYRDFSGPAPEGMVLPSPIMIEAADRIEELEKDRKILFDALLEAISIIAKYDQIGAKRWLEELGIKV